MFAIFLAVIAVAFNQSAFVCDAHSASWESLAWELYAKSQIWTTPHQSEV